MLMGVYHFFSGLDDNAEQLVYIYHDKIEESPNPRNRRPKRRIRGIGVLGAESADSAIP